jgi:hypothetical protein
MKGDEALQQAFKTLRAEDERRTVPFDRILHRSPRTGHFRWRPVFGASVLVVLVLAGVELEFRHRPAFRASKEPAPFILAWKSPTDFLLNTPGSELMRNAPGIGSSIDFGLVKPAAPTRKASPSLSAPEHSS